MPIAFALVRCRGRFQSLIPCRLVPKRVRLLRIALWLMVEICLLAAGGREVIAKYEFQVWVIGCRLMFISNESLALCLIQLEISSIWPDSSRKGNFDEDVQPKNLELPNRENQVVKLHCLIALDGHTFRHSRYRIQSSLKYRRLGYNNTATSARLTLFNSSLIWLTRGIREDASGSVSAFQVPGKAWRWLN